MCYTIEILRYTWGRRQITGDASSPMLEGVEYRVRLRGESGEDLAPPFTVDTLDDALKCAEKLMAAKENEGEGKRA